MDERRTDDRQTLIDRPWSIDCRLAIADSSDCRLAIVDSSFINFKSPIIDVPVG